MEKCRKLPFEEIESIGKYIYAVPQGALRQLFISFLISQRKLVKDEVDVHAYRGRISEDVLGGKEVPGDWEGDLIIGRNYKSALGTLVEKRSRYVILVPVLGKKNAKSIRESFSEVLHKIDLSDRLSMPGDRELKMVEHKIFSEEMGVKVCFLDPKSLLQRRTTESPNAFIREYFPERTDFSRVTLEEIKFAQNQLNERPRKILNFFTPKEIFQQLMG